jgi:hypothetical protein
VLLTLAVNGYGQACKIEFYLLKTDIDLNLYDGKPDFFDKLQDTAFITDDEIISFSIQRYTRDNKTIERHFFYVSKNVISRIGFGGQTFALLVDGNIVYRGYFLNIFSSLDIDGIVAFAYNEKIEISRKLPDYGYENEEEDVSDMRKNPILFDCLKSTNRIKDND